MREMSASYHVVRGYSAPLGRFTGWVRVRGAYSLSAATMIENAEVTDHAGSENVKTKKRRVNRVLFSNYDRSDRTIAGCWVGRNCGEAFITV